MINKVFSGLYVAFIFLSSFFFLFIAVAIWLTTILFDRRLRVLHLFTCFWASLYVWLMPRWRVIVEGREKISPDQKYIIVSNHQSQLDILVAFHLFVHFKWISKAEVFTIPFIGWNMVLNQYIKLKRGDKKSISTMMRACEKSLDIGNSLYFFPEGTRSYTGIVKPFKHGAFSLAKKKEIPILPVVINGTRQALPKYSLNFQTNRSIRLTVLKPIQPEAFKNLSVSELAEKVRTIISEQVDEQSQEKRLD